MQAFLDGVIWLSLLTLPVRPEVELKASTQQILARRPDLLSTVLTMLFERFPTLTPEEIMEIATIPAKDLRHTRAAQQLIEKGRLEGEATTARIQALPLQQLETLAEALLDFSGATDLAAWLNGHSG